MFLGKFSLFFTFSLFHFYFTHTTTGRESRHVRLDRAWRGRTDGHVRACAFAIAILATLFPSRLGCGWLDQVFVHGIWAGGDLLELGWDDGFGFEKNDFSGWCFAYGGGVKMGIGGLWETGCTKQEHACTTRKQGFQSNLYL